MGFNLTIVELKLVLLLVPQTVSDRFNPTILELKLVLLRINNIDTLN